MSTTRNSDVWCGGCWIKRPTVSDNHNRHQWRPLNFWWLPFSSHSRKYTHKNCRMKMGGQLLSVNFANCWIASNCSTNRLFFLAHLKPSKWFKWSVYSEGLGLAINTKAYWYNGKAPGISTISLKMLLYHLSAIKLIFLFFWFQFVSYTLLNNNNYLPRSLWLSNKRIFIKNLVSDT